MKRFTALFLGLLMILSSLTTAFADTDWTYAYSEELKKIEKEEVYDSFALYDIDKDGTPELIVRKDDYRNFVIYTMDKSKIKKEHSFYALSFHEEVKSGDLVVYYSRNKENYFAKYDEDKGINDWTVLFKSLESKDGNKYYEGSKEIKQTEYNKLVKENLKEASIVFYNLNENNIKEYVYSGALDTDRNPAFAANKASDGTVVINFPDAKNVKYKDSGEKEIFGLLMVKGKTISSAFPINEADRTLIPIRAVSENLNAKVDWDGELSKVVISKDIKIEMYIGEKTALVNGEKVQMDVPARIINDITYVPARFVSENLGTDIFYWSGTDEFPPIINIEEKATTEKIREKEAVEKVKALMDEVEWIGKKTDSFTQNHMSKKLDYKYEDEIVGRFHSVILDIEENQRIWVDKYTGQVYSVYTTRDKFGISPGTENVINALVEEYIGY